MTQPRKRNGQFSEKQNSAPEARIGDYRIANPDYARAMHGLRSSSAASPHDNRPNRQRTRADARKAAIRDQD